MTDENVLVSISGIQFGEDNEGAIEITNKGKAFVKNDTNYVMFEEVLEGFDGTVKNLIKYKDGYVSVTKKGVVNVNMEFQESKKSMNCYATPYGDIMMGIDTKSIEILHEKDSVLIEVNYSLEANYEFLANSRVKIAIRPQKEGISLISPV